MPKIHYHERYREGVPITRCGLEGDNLVLSASMDDVTCKRCLNAPPYRKPPQLVLLDGMEKYRMQRDELLGAAEAVIDSNGLSTNIPERYQEWVVSADSMRALVQAVRDIHACP